MTCAELVPLAERTTASPALLSKTDKSEKSSMPGTPESWILSLVTENR